MPKAKSSSFYKVAKPGTWLYSSLTFSPPHTHTKKRVFKKSQNSEKKIMRSLIGKGMFDKAKTLLGSETKNTKNPSEVFLEMKLLLLEGGFCYISLFLGVSERKYWIFGRKQEEKDWILIVMKERQQGRRN